MQTIKKILITGGHRTSALAVISELKKIDSNLSFIWVGHRYSMVNDTNDSAEYKDITSLNIPFFDIKAGKFYKIYSPIRLFKIFTGFVNAFFLLLKEKPDVVLSFGGYIAVPVVISAWILRIPSATHEQTVIQGYANKALIPFVSKIFISWEASRKAFPPHKTLFTGLPLRSEIFEISSHAFDFSNSKPIIYITGGKQGTHKINEIILTLLPKLLEKYNIIHQCGNNSVYNDFEKLKQLKATLTLAQANSFIVRDYIYSNEIGTVLNKSNLIVSRSGAHTIFELLALKKRSLLIPIPWVSHNEQFLNAKVVKDYGYGEILEEKDLTEQNLENAIDSAMNIDLSKAKEFEYEKDSARIIAYETLKL